MQSNPNRAHSGLNGYHRRLRNIKVTGVGWRYTIACNCCTMKTGNHRHWQKRLSKQKTLRDHRC